MNRKTVYAWYLVNVIMTYLEQKVIKPLVNDNTINFYTRYVGDTLFVIKREDVRRIQNLLNNLRPKLAFHSRLI